MVSADGTVRETATSSGQSPLYDALIAPLVTFHDVVHSHLASQAHKPGLRGEVARQLLASGHRAEQLIEQEYIDRRDAIGGIDQMWLHLSQYDFNPVCVACYILGDAASYDRLSEVLDTLADKFPKYKSKLSNVGRRFHGSTFVLDDTFKTQNHFTVKRLPGKAGKEELDDFVAAVCSLPWDFDKPLWEAYLIENYTDEAVGAHSAIVMRGHHSLTDGQGFVMSQLAVTSYGPQLEGLLKDAVGTIHDAKRGQALPSKMHKGLKPLDAFHKYLPFQLALFFAFWTFFIVSSYFEALFSLFQASYMAAMFLLTFWRCPQVTPHYPGPRTKAKQYAISQSFPISDVKKIQKAFSGVRQGSWLEVIQPGRINHTILRHLTLNDVLCTILADVIGHDLRHPPLNYASVASNGLWQRFIALSHKVLPLPVSLGVPISIRQPGDWSMQNWSTGALAYLPNDGGLPKGPDELYKRLHANRRALTVLKHGFVPSAAFWLINLSTRQFPLLFPSPLWTPFQWVISTMLSFTMSSFTAVLTNVPGPPAQPNNEPITIGGSPIIKWSASPPQAGKGTMGIGVITYGGEVCVTITADKVDLAEDGGSSGGTDGNVARRICRAFEERWDDYLKAANLVLEKEEMRKQALKLKQAQKQGGKGQ